MVKPVLLIRSENNGVDSSALEKLGIPSHVDPYMEITAASDHSEGLKLMELLRTSKQRLWVVATSRNSIRYWADLVGEAQFRAELKSHAHLKFAAIGGATAQVLRDYGASEIFLPSDSRAEILGQELATHDRQSHALIPGGNLALPNLAAILRSSGWSVHTAEVYRTSRVRREPTSADLLRDGAFSAVLLRSPSAVDALTHFVPHPPAPLVCAGATTAAAVQAHGLQVDAISAQPTPEVVADTIHSLIFH
ncbi:MAG: uroporphyrinogen-III synthase [Candidatus Planktophila sp.]|nr:uroporphyrinogen-III synthase [Candidatus Planktophila sp.]